ncbi:hypothetical protein BCR43DRAFT_505747 [Syncephalastrum racemosum]|uniref:Uncharacterized protein n=1 Tax=Syncephalastrum racemosum TaxID=13706 RepID=A0A1X2HDU2_SYNRA|nr:hypothetical protein BCR43DRAFT_509067 [Syncephalastrum racemosum]ORY96967.1 hypothetical protein BCR43DRAFT_505747 [Syncephalastrum racemosum]
MVEKGLQLQNKADTIDKKKNMVARLQQEINEYEESHLEYAEQIMDMARKCPYSTQRQRYAVFRTLFKRHNKNAYENDRLVRRIVRKVDRKQRASRASPDTEHM